MRSWLLALVVVAVFACGAWAQEDKKTDDLKPADPDTGESTVEEERFNVAFRILRQTGRQVRGDLHRRGLGQSDRRCEAGRCLRGLASTSPQTSISKN